MKLQEAIIKGIQAYKNEFGGDAEIPEGGKISIIADGIGTVILTVRDGKYDVLVIETTYTVSTDEE